MPRDHHDQLRRNAAGGRHRCRAGSFRFLSLLLAVTIHVTSELAFILNPARLLPRRI
jgi:hypothetical protein